MSIKFLGKDEWSLVIHEPDSFIMWEFPTSWDLELFFNDDVETRLMRHYGKWHIWSMFDANYEHPTPKNWFFV
jgi:hypothetical protein